MKIDLTDYESKKQDEFMIKIQDVIDSEFGEKSLHPMSAVAMIVSVFMQISYSLIYNLAVMNNMNPSKLFRSVIESTLRNEKDYEKEMDLEFKKWEEGKKKA